MVDYLLLSFYYCPAYA